MSSINRPTFDIDTDEGLVPLSVFHGARVSDLIGQASRLSGREEGGLGPLDLGPPKVERLSVWTWEWTEPGDEHGLTDWSGAGRGVADVGLERLVGLDAAAAQGRATVLATAPSSLSELAHAPSGAPLEMWINAVNADQIAGPSESSFSFRCGCGCGASGPSSGHDAAAAAGPGDAYGAGRTQLIAQTYNAAQNRYEFSGDRNIDATLIGSRLTTANVTFSFPTSGAFYTDGYDPNATAEGSEPNTFQAFNAMQQNAARYALYLISSYTNLNFTEITETSTTHANLRFGQTSAQHVPSAFANFPSSKYVSGDVWFGMTGTPHYDTPQIGNWGQATIMHEIGHTMGLKHGHQDATTVDLATAEGGLLDAPAGGGPRYGSSTLEDQVNGQDWSLMTYHRAPGIGPQYGGDGFNEPQTYRAIDIAALQYLYGADFTTNGGDTTYTWNPGTGAMSINGVLHHTPTSNKVAMTLWDGNGIDTYDLSNYSIGVRIDLNPGAFSTFSREQLVNHTANADPSLAYEFYAAGNVSNALLYNNDVRSLIENAKGGSGADFIVGNQAANALTGNNGADTLIGGIGNDTLLGDGGDDFLFGDGRAAMPSGVSMGSGSLVKNAGAGNSSIQTAMNIGGAFSLSNDPDIVLPTTAAHVSIQAATDNNRDYYKLTLNAGAFLILDIDYASDGFNGFDSFIRLLDASGNVLAYDDDSNVGIGAGGSYAVQDSFLTFVATYSGTYIIEVGQYASATTNAAIPAGYTYELQVSAADASAVGSGTGNDTLNGGTGADVMTGGAGNDTYYVDGAGDQVIEAAGQGTDTVVSAINYTLGANVEHGEVGVTAGRTLKGNTLNNRLTGNTGDDALEGFGGNDVLDGGAGTDIMRGGAGNDSYYVERAADQIIELAGEGIDTVRATNNYTLAANVENGIIATTSNRTMNGNDLDNVLTGNIGNDVLDGRAGVDTLRGGKGNDTYYVDRVGEVIVELAGEGIDTVRATSHYTLAANVENGIVMATGNRTLTGNDLDNVLTGNIGDDVLDGKAGVDTLRGGKGNDSYYVDRVGEVIVELAGEGIDTVRATSHYTLAANVENGIVMATGNRTLTGNDLDNVLTGNIGDDILDGKAGVDTLRGGKGNDTYYVDRTGDIIIENPGDGTDTVRATSHYILGANVENGIIATTSGRTLKGNALDNVLTGNNGNDVLDGMGGVDTLRGGRGDDTYYVDRAGDVVVENAGQGTDTVRTTANYTLGANVENGIVNTTSGRTLTGNALNNVLTGNAGADVLRGGAGNDRLNGGSGADRMEGGTGNDIYYVDHSGDVVVEAVGGGGDLVYSSVTFNASATDVERITLTGSGATQIVANGLANTLIGNSGANAIYGAGGADTITGGAGADRFVYKAVSDSTYSVYDRITDLQSIDRIELAAIDANTNLAGNQAFVLVDSFTGVGGQITLTYNAAAGFTVLAADVNGDKVADMRIVLNGNHENFTNFIF